MSFLKPFIVLLAGVFIVGVAGCSVGAPQITKISEKQYSIFVQGAMKSTQAEMIAIWKESANSTCKGKYDVVDTPKTRRDGYSMVVEGSVRCK
jgi:hypothetical protein